MENFVTRPSKTFVALCKFRRLQNDVVRTYNAPDGRSIADRVPFAYVESKFQELLAWANDIPGEARRGEHQPHHVIILQYVCTHRQKTGRLI
jgi:hypothetical protein